MTKIDQNKAAPQYVQVETQGTSKPQEPTAGDKYCPTPPGMKYFHRIDNGNDAIKRALRSLGEEVRKDTANTTRHNPIFTKSNNNWFGHEVRGGEVGCVIEGGLPRLILEPGKYYWNKPNRHWAGTQPLKALNFRGFQTRLLQQNEAAIVSDSNDHVFPVNGAGGFASYNLQGDYDVLNVAQRNTEDPKFAVMDPDTRKVLLGYRVRIANKNGSTVAQLLNIPANNVAIVQRGNKYEEIEGGQHTLTDPAVTFKRFFTKGDMIIDAKPEDVYTKDQVAVSISLAVKLQLKQPLKLVEHGFESPYQALRDPIQSALISVVSRLKYTDFMAQQGLATETLSSRADNSPFEEEVQARCLDKLKDTAREYGIELKFVQVTNRTFRGDLVKTLQDLTTRTMTVNQEAQLVRTENSNRQQAAQGKQLVTQVEAQQIETLAQANFTKSVKESEAAAQSKVNAAEAEKKAAILRAEGEAEAMLKLANARASAIKVQSDADQSVVNPHAQRMQQLRNNVEQISAMGNRTVIIPQESVGSVATHYAAGLGLQVASTNERRSVN